MSKTKTAFFCRNCGAQSSKWMGRCNSCDEWNTIIEEVIQRDSDKSTWEKASREKSKKKEKPQLIHEIEINNEARIDTCNSELNRVLGGGLVSGSLILIGGEPGIGKSTLMLQVAVNIRKRNVLYVTGEESSQQIKIRGGRSLYLP